MTRCALCLHDVIEDLRPVTLETFRSQLSYGLRTNAMICVDPYACIARAQARRGSPDVDG